METLVGERLGEGVEIPTRRAVTAAAKAAK
jgi:hypothetical protein